VELVAAHARPGADRLRRRRVGRRPQELRVLGARVDLGSGQQPVELDDAAVAIESEVDSDHAIGLPH
jgi:hypothetical protein